MEHGSLEVRRQQDLEAALLEADNIVMKKYMNGISKCEVKEMDQALASVDLNSVFRLNKVEKLVYHANENNLEKLMNVYNAVGLCGGSVVNMIISDGKNVDYYLGTRAQDVNEVTVCQDTLTGALTGNFPGTTVALQRRNALQQCLGRIFGEDVRRSVTVVSGIPGYRNEDNKENAKYVQGIERVIDSMRGKAFALLTISSPLSASQIETIKTGYESLYTQISPFAETQLSYNESDSNAVAESVTEGITKTVGESLTNTVSNATTRTTGTNTSKSFSFSPIIASASASSGTSSSTGTQEGTASAAGHNYARADSRQVGKTDTYTNTSGRSLQIRMENKAVKDLLKKIDDMIARIEASADLGLWNTATYCITDHFQTSQVLASAVEAVCRGDKASVESFAVESWTDPRKSRAVQEYLKKMVHPVVLVAGNHAPFEVNPASLISGKELVIEAGLPHKSVPGVPVSEMVAFSRNVVHELVPDGQVMELGHISHMGAIEGTSVCLDIESLSAHTLITGSTGSGKSNTVYHMLTELKKHGVKFLVVEPAKGEYKNVFGKDRDVTVYGTNEKYAELLRIDPFKFPQSVHVLEHIDRLIELFNVCWPMYAAMPAVLKDAVLCAYESCGWDLEESENPFGDEIFPTFKDLQRELIAVLDRSAYSDEVKGNYIGSLATRVKSLTNGINGKIFTDNALDYARLFDENVLVDLSRVGSTETKSLIMGLLVMALHEYRMDRSAPGTNRKLNHITVLEEAHHLLRASSSMAAAAEEGGSLAGKSVEMIANAIAEMRTYGEGFIVVDQSPGAIDLSAIRNTNTKIIMRLPDEADRKQAGRSAALKDTQIDELAKLRRGTAVVYQNNWLDPVLCAVKKASVWEAPYSVPPRKAAPKNDCTALLAMLLHNRVDEKTDTDLDTIERVIENANLSTKSKLILREVMDCERRGSTAAIMTESAFKNLSDLVVEILGFGEKLHQFAEYGENCALLQQELNRQIERVANSASKELKLAISQCILREMAEADSRQVELYARWREFAVDQRKLG